VFQAYTKDPFEFTSANQMPPAGCRINFAKLKEACGPCNEKAIDLSGGTTHNVPATPQYDHNSAVNPVSGAESEKDSTNAVVSQVIKLLFIPRCADIIQIWIVNSVSSGKFFANRCEFHSNFHGRWEQRFIFFQLPSGLKWSGWNIKICGKAKSCRYGFAIVDEESLCKNCIQRG